MNNDIRVSVGFRTHPKAVKLVRRLGKLACYAVIQLWAWVATEHPDGVLTGMDAEDIAIAADWDGGAAEFVQVLIEQRWLDRGEDGVLAVHNWAERNPYAASAEERSERARRAAYAKHGKEYPPPVPPPGPGRGAPAGECRRQSGASGTAATGMPNPAMSRAAHAEPVLLTVPNQTLPEPNAAQTEPPPMVGAPTCAREDEAAVGEVEIIAPEGGLPPTHPLLRELFGGDIIITPDDAELPGARRAEVGGQLVQFPTPPPPAASIVPELKPHGRDLQQLYNFALGLFREQKLDLAPSETFELSQWLAAGIPAEFIKREMADVFARQVAIKPNNPPGGVWYFRNIIPRRWAERQSTSAELGRIDGELARLEADLRLRYEQLARARENPSADRVVQGLEATIARLYRDRGQAERPSGRTTA